MPWFLEPLGVRYAPVLLFVGWFGYHFRSLPVASANHLFSCGLQAHTGSILPRSSKLGF